MTEREALQLVFLPGFSTAAEVTNVSGRGVGMDVVRANVEKVGGSVEIESRLGAGTTLRMRVPLTLAIVPALVVRSGGAELCAAAERAGGAGVCSASARRRGAIERMGGAELYRLRERSAAAGVAGPPAGPGVGAGARRHGFYICGAGGGGLPVRAGGG